MITLRLGNRHHKDITLLHELIEELRKHPKACDEVWFASEYGFAPLDVHERSARLMAEAAELFEQLNIRTSLQISNTIGHGEYMKSKDCSGLVYEGSNAEQMVGPNGECAAYCFCWNGENFRKYTYRVIQMYASFKPHSVWFDDDLRSGNHYPVEYGCFCSACIEKFNKKYETKFDRTSLVHEINYGDVLWRERWIEFVREGVGSFARMAAEAVRSVSPESFLGLQYAMGSYYSGCDVEHVLGAFHEISGRTVKSRPGGGFYNDHDPNGMLEKALFMAHDNAKTPDYVKEWRPEIENLPDVAFGKSNYGTCLESSLYLAFGNNALSYATLMNDWEPMSWHGKMFDMFEKHRPYWKRLSAASNIGKCGGLFLVKSPRAYRMPLSEEQAPFTWTEMNSVAGKELLRCGIPLCYNADRACAGLLLSDAVDSLEDADIEMLLGKPVVMDVFALEKLEKRGFSNKIGLGVLDKDIYGYIQRFTKHSVNVGIENKNWSQSPFGVNKGGKMLVDIAGRAEIISEYGTRDSDERVGIADAVTETKYGAKWAVLGYNIRDNILSFDKRNQIIQICDYVCDGRLPAVLDAPYQAAVIPIVDSNGRTVSVTIFNCSVADTEEMRLIIRNPVGKRFDLMDENNLTKNLDFRRLDGGVELVIPSLRGWRIATVFSTLP